MKNKIILYCYIISIGLPLCISDVAAQNNDSLLIKSKKEVGQIEVGSPYVGIEIHKSFPMLNRISFYYPVANSIDISEDYWKRENYRIISVGLKVGESPKRFLEKEIYEVEQTPYTVSFTKQKYESDIKISYEFCKNQPAMVITYEITNKSNTEKDYEIYTRLETILRTSHSYKLKDKALTQFEKNGAIIRINYDEIETGNAQVFIANVGLLPSSFTTVGDINLDEWWLNNNGPLTGKTIQKKTGKPAAAYIYKKKLLPGNTLKIIQVIGSSKINEAEERTKYLLNGYGKEVAEYEKYVLEEALTKKEITTGDEDLDFTAHWAKAVLSTNKHYIDGHIVPMPAQAQYNFYFTHDALLTDLAAVNFDLARVKNDLKFIIKHANAEKVIPHAYYWKDTDYKTEFAGTENWNHFWFVMLCARYLRHSNDVEFTKVLYPYVVKSIQTALMNKGEDGLMWSFRPDWWDIGNNLGPRAYMTILAVRALREFNFISAALDKDLSIIKYYEESAERMHNNLIDKLWDDKLNYLISYYEDGSKDDHIYMGSLLASHLNLLDEIKNRELIATAKKYLLDERLGIYTLYPMDFHELIDFMKFAGNEAGEPYHYANGGIWPHGNAWYALSLINNGFKDEAYEFIKKIMTIRGAIDSPNGQPAMYEYRISDKTNPEIYGKVDKPQFLWAGGWYLYTLYNLFGISENEWNISFDPYIPEELESIKLSLTVNGELIPIEINGHGKTISTIFYNGTSIPSAIIPSDFEEPKNIAIKLGKTNTPYLSSANTKIKSPEYNNENKILNFVFESFKSHLAEFEITSPFEPEEVLINDKEKLKHLTQEIGSGIRIIKIKYALQQNDNSCSIKFK